VLRAARPVAVAAVVAVIFMVAQDGAWGAWARDVPPGCHLERVDVNEGGAHYRTVCPGAPGDGSGGGSSGPAVPSCVLSGLNDYCIGTSVCWSNVPSAIPVESWPVDSRPSVDAIYTYQSCDPDPSGTLTGWSWYTPPQMSAAQAAREAFGSLATPVFTVGFNPPGRAVVGVPTWLWAQTAQAGVITGSSALGVVAVGEPARLEIDPGDGSGVLDCPWSTAASGVCAYTYARSSAGQPVGAGGQPAYTVRMRLVYRVRFENNGAQFEVAGLPGTLESPWRTVSVPVAEIQALVTLGGS